MLKCFIIIELSSVHIEPTQDFYDDLVIEISETSNHIQYYQYFYFAHKV
jgi:hypothetical protein